MTAQSYRLTIQNGPKIGETFELDKDDVRIGRGTANDIVLPEKEISREHARLYIQPGGYVIEDLGSTNGTYIDGQRLIGPHLLVSGETISLGEKINLVYEPIIDPDATIVPSLTAPSAQVTTPVSETSDEPQPEQTVQPQHVPPYAPTQPEKAVSYTPQPVQPAVQPVQPPQPVYQEQVQEQHDQSAEPYEEEPPLISWRWVAAGFGCLTIVVCVLVIAALFWIDAGGEARWCEYLGFLFPACP